MHQNNLHTEVIIKHTQQRGVIYGYNFDNIQNLISNDVSAPEKLMPVSLNKYQTVNIPLKDLVILKNFTQSTQIAVQLIVNKKNN